MKDPDNPRSILIAAGGTAGHINPGLAVAARMREREPGCRILFVGTDRSLEKDLVGRAGYPLKTIPARGLNRKVTLAGIRDNIRAMADLARGMREARRILDDFRPDVVMGTGGFVCGPVLYQAVRMRIRTVIHESNSYPGLTNRLLAGKVDVVAVGFREAARLMPRAEKRGKIRYTGNPVRTDILKADRESARSRLGIAPDRKLVVFVGGSRGGARLNTIVTEMISNYYDGSYDILYATGESGYEKVMASMTRAKEENRPSHVRVLPYIYNAAEVYAAADLVVCRAGALTVAEMTVMGKPTIMVPSPYVTENHQEKNARVLEDAGACLVLKEQELTGKLLGRMVRDTIANDGLLSSMGRNAAGLGVRDALDRICDLLG